MGDDELEALRARRLAEMQTQYGRKGGVPSQKDDEEAKEKMKEMKNSILSQVLDQSARARLNTIAVAKPEKAQMIEGMLIQMAQTGQIQSKLTEDQLIGLLSRVTEQTQKKTTVKVPNFAEDILRARKNLYDFGVKWSNPKITDRKKKIVSAQ